MKILEEYFESERILTYIDALTITAKECNELKRYGHRERKEIIKEYKELRNSNKLPRETNPRDYITEKLLTQRNFSTKYNNKSTLRREIIYANAILPNDVTIAELLNNNHFSFEHLKKIIEVRKKILFLIKSKNTTITDDLIKDIAIYKKIVTKLINLFESKFGINDSTIILNRICEMLVTCPTFFESKSYTR